MIEEPASTEGFLAGVTVLELADELGEYAGKVLAGLGAEVIKVEPPGGESTRRYGPFLDDRSGDPNASLYFWHYNFGKKGIVLDLDSPTGRESFARLAARADVILDTRGRRYLADRGLGYENLVRQNPKLIYSRVSPFGDDGPWGEFQGSDLIHLALGGVVMNCGYDPEPGGHYDTPPIAPQMWQAYHIAGEYTAMAVLAALGHRLQTGLGQSLVTSVHQAVATNTETDHPDWIYQRRPHYRQTCRHSMADVALPSLARTKDGRWILPYRTYLRPGFADLLGGTAQFLQNYGLGSDLGDERFQDQYKRSQADRVYVSALADLLVGSFKYERDLWREAQKYGLPWAPIRRPEENVAEEHWRQRETFMSIEHPDLGRSLDHVGAKWFCAQVPWRRGPNAPKLDEHTEEVLSETSEEPLASLAQDATEAKMAVQVEGNASALGQPFALEGVRVLDLAWLLASAGAGRFLSGFGAEVIKVEHRRRLDAMRFGIAFAPPGGRTQRDNATETIPNPQSDSPNRSGMFNEINPGKLSLALDLKSDEGKKILTELIKDADLILEGFSPGTMDRMGFGYDRLREINPRIIYVQQSGMGQVGTYGNLRSYGPTAQAISGISDMSGLPEPYPPAGIGYSYLDWFGAYNMAVATLAALYRQRATGAGCWIDASQAETGIYLTGTAVLDASANGRTWQRSGNRSPYKPAAPHGIYPVQGTDRWIAIACFTEEHWDSLRKTPGFTDLTDARFEKLADRLGDQDALDELLGLRTAKCDGLELMAMLQEAGVPAGICQTTEDKCDSDPQLRHLRWMVELLQTEIGTWPIREFPVVLGATPSYAGGRLDRAAPSYGEDSDYVLREILGRSAEDISVLRAAGVID